MLDWERNTVSNIMLRVGTGSAPVQATEVSTQHLDLRTYPSDAGVAPGTRFSLALDITLPVRYPASEIYHFAPLNERVPVYQKRFTLLMNVVPDATLEARKVFAGKNELVVTGTLEYQACDDKLCYNPVSLPLSWKVDLRGNVPGAPQPPTR